MNGSGEFKPAPSAEVLLKGSKGGTFRGLGFRVSI